MATQGAARRAVEEGNLALAKAELLEQTARAQTQAAEESRSQIELGLGAPGTYETDYETYYRNLSAPGGTGLQLLGGDVYDKTTSDVLRLQQMSGGIKGLRKDLSAATTDEQKIAAVKKHLDQKLKVDSGQFTDAALLEFANNPTRGAFQKTSYARGVGGPGQLAEMETGKILDPQKYAQSVLQSRGGRLQSYLTAQADQIARREGPLWQQLQESVMGPIVEGSTQLMRESSEEIHRMVARGGSARRAGMAEAMKLRAQENINRDRTQALWQSNLALNQWGIENARTQLTFNQAWINNLGGVRDTFNQTMTQMAQFYGSTILPAATNLAAQNYQLSLSQKKSGTGAIVAGVGMALAGVLAPFTAGTSLAFLPAVIGAGAGVAGGLLGGGGAKGAVIGGLSGLAAGAAAPGVASGIKGLFGFGGTPAAQAYSYGGTTAGGVPYGGGGLMGTPSAYPEPNFELP